MFAKSGFKMEVPFVTRNKEVFQCSVKSVDFEDPNAACDSINQWVKNETRGEYWRALFCAWQGGVWDLSDLDGNTGERCGGRKSSALQLKIVFKLTSVWYFRAGGPGISSLTAPADVPVWWPWGKRIVCVCVHLPMGSGELLLFFAFIQLVINPSRVLLELSQT